MVSKPDYDPNTIASDWESVNGEGSTSLYNRATQGQYAPGSVFKIFTALEYYNENPSTYNDYSFDCDGSITKDGFTIHCAGNKSHGQEDLTKSFAKSCNSSFSNIGLLCSNQRAMKTDEVCGRPRHPFGCRRETPAKCFTSTVKGSIISRIQSI